MLQDLWILQLAGKEEAFMKKRKRALITENGAYIFILPFFVIVFYLFADSAVRYSKIQLF